MSLLTLQDFYKETITVDCPAGATNIYVSNKPIPTEGYLVISAGTENLREIIKYTATGTDGTGDYVTVSDAADRGLGGTSDIAHVASETIRMNYTAEHQQDTSDAIDQIVAGGAQDASTSTKGIVKMSVAPVSATEPIAVGDNDPRLPSTDLAAALVGGGGTPSATNKFQTKYDTRFGVNIRTAGATIAGATLPVPVYQNKTDNEFYACDANDTAAMKFLGFAISDGTDGNPIDVQFSGIVTGFTGLAEGEKYYVQDAVGTIGTSIGTYEILVGVAISETELLIQKGKRRAVGATSISSITATGSEVITCGFRPAFIRVYGTSQPQVSGLASSSMMMIWANGITKASNIFINTVGSLGTTDARIYDSTSANYLTFSITSVTDTGFTITYTETGNFDVDQGSYSWEAEGEL